MNLEIGLSTLNSGVYKIKFSKLYNYLIIHQISDGKDYSNFIETLPDNVKYIPSYSVGLSLSRNMAIDNASSEYIWLMDDDVEINDDAFSYIEEYITRYSNSPLLIVSHSIGDLQYKPGEVIRKLNLVSAAKICSIDMIIKVNALNGVRFNTDFGLGAKYSSGEEYIFACDLINNGAEIFKSDRQCSIHPEIFIVEHIYKNKNELKTKLKMFVTANGILRGGVLFLAFIFKKKFLSWF